MAFPVSPLTWLWLWLATCPPVLTAAGEILTAERLDVDKGLLSNQAYYVHQDRVGFLWLAALPGLARFDGRNWEFFRSERKNRTGPSSLNVYNMCEDRCGNLWLATGLGLDRFDLRRREFRYYVHDPADPASLGPGEVLDVHILAAQPDTLWIANDGGGLNSMNMRSGKISHWARRSGAGNSCRGLRSYLLFEDSRGCLWVATDQGLNRYDPRRRAFSFHPPPLQRVAGQLHETTCLFESAAYPGVIWICTRGSGLIRFEPDHDRWRVLTRDRRNPASLPSDFTYMVTDWPHRDGQLLVSTDEGFCRFDPIRETCTPVTLVADGQEIPKQTGYMYATTDRSGVLWLTSIYLGVFKIIPRRTNPVAWHESPAADAPHVDRLTHDGNGHIWMACNYSNNRFRIFRHDLRSGAFSLQLTSPPESVYAWAGNILCSRSGLVWVPTTDGLFRLDPANGSIHAFRPSPANPDTVGLDRSEYIAEDWAGTLWLGSRLGVLEFDPERQTFRRHHHASGASGGLSNDRVNDMLVDRRGTLWVGSPGGLDRYDPQHKRFVPVTASQPGQALSDSRVTVFFEDGRDRLWVGTGYGLNLLIRNGESRSFRHFILPGGEPNNMIQCLVGDDQRNLWIATPKGLNCLPNGSAEFLFFDHHDGLPGAGFLIQNGLLDEAGRIWLGGKSGFITFRPRDLLGQWSPPAVALSAVSLDGRPMPVGPDAPAVCHPPYTRNVTVPASFRALSLSWAAFDSIRPERTQFTWRLAGADGAGSWQPLGFASSMTLSGLAPGRYTVQVRAADHNGHWSPAVAEVSVTVLSRWWLRRESLLSAVALLLVAALLGVRGWRAYKRRLTRTLAEIPENFEATLNKYDLTARELEVLRLVLRGRSNKEIEDALFISLSTVKAHIGSIYRKLGVNSRLQLINFAAHRNRKPG